MPTKQQKGNAVAQHLLCFKLGIALVFVGGILFAFPATGFAEPEKKQKSIRLGVDPEHYLQNRHKRVNQARQQADQRRTGPIVVRSGTSTRYSGTVAENEAPALSPYPGLEDRPGFNEFSHLNADERQNAEEIMQFLKSFQPTATP